MLRRFQCRQIFALVFGVLTLGISMTQAQIAPPQATRAAALYDEGFNLLNNGTAADLPTALDKFRQAKELWTEIGFRKGVADALGMMGNVIVAQGDPRLALDHFNQSLAITREIGDHESEATNLSSVGGIYVNQGEFQKALTSYTAALALNRIYSDKIDTAITLNNLGFIYSELGEKQQAIDHFAEALPLYHDGGDTRGEATTLSNIGLIYLQLKQSAQAIDYFTRSLALKRSAGDKRGEATTLNNLGKVYAEAGDTTKALEYYRSSLELRQLTGDLPGEGTAYNNIGHVYFDQRNAPAAVDSYYQAAWRYHAVDGRDGESTALANLLEAWDLLGNPRLAVAFGKQAVLLRQQIRSDMRGLDRTTQQSYLKRVEAVYRRLATVLIRSERLAEAHQVLNLLKDQQYFDLDAPVTRSLSLTPAEAEFGKVLDQRLDRVSAARLAIDAYRRDLNGAQPNSEQTASQARLALGLVAAIHSYFGFLHESESEFAKPASEPPLGVSDSANLQAALRRRSIDSGEETVAVYLLAGEDRYRALIVSPERVVAVDSPMTTADLDRKALQLWRLLRTPTYDPRPLAREVYQAIFVPVLPALPAKTQTILWSLDGNLRYVPMSALFDGRRYLVERYNNAIFTRENLERMTSKPSRVLTGSGMGSATAHTVELGKSRFEASALPAVRTELARIFGDPPGRKGVLRGNVLLDSAFTRDAMLAELGKHRPLVHIASHFRFVPGDEGHSFLLLGDGSPFTLDQMRIRKDLFAGVELLTLSACETAAQQADANGREVDGFSELAQRLGARAVMASLWEVSDISTAQLMSHFYLVYGELGGNKAGSLRLAQLTLLQNRAQTGAAAPARLLLQKDAAVAGQVPIPPAQLRRFKKDPRTPFAHPYYWSPFILIGDPR